MNEFKMMPEQLEADVVEGLEEEEEEEEEEDEFYAAAAKYWERIPATVDGMLGGFGFISQIDIKSSSMFLRALFESKDPPSKTYALDCGAGIGRITKNLLINYFKRVDLVEQNPKFLEAARVNLNDCSARIGDYFSIGLQDFNPREKRYDVIWSQWVLGHLRDDDLVRFFKKCSSALRTNGLLIVKENVTSSESLDIDKVDSSVTRPLSTLKYIFQQSGLACVKEERQNKFPRHLYPVYMFALRPLDARLAS